MALDEDVEDYFNTNKLEGECIETISLAEAIKIIGTPARTRTGANGLGNRCSIRLSYRGMCLERCIDAD